MNVKVRLFSVPQKVFKRKIIPFLTRLSGYFTDQTGIHAPKAMERKQPVNKASFSLAYFTRIPFIQFLRVVRKKKASYEEENDVFHPVKR